MKPTAFWIRTSLVLILVCAIVLGPGCASTKNVMNKATFGLVGDSEDKAPEKDAKRQAEAEKKADKKARKQQEKTEKQARKQEKEMAKAQAEQPDPSNEPKRGIMSKATFGLVGGESEENKAEKKEAKRQAEADKKAAKQAKKEREKADKQARKQEEEMAKTQAEQPDPSNEPKRGIMSKATFGLVGGESEEKAAKKEAKRQAEEQEKADKRAAKEERKAQEREKEEQKQAEKQARKEEAQVAEAQPEPSEQPDPSDEPKRGLMSKATFGLVGGDSEDKTEKKEAKRQAEEQEKADKQARKEQEQADKQARKEEKKMAKAETDPADPSDEPKRGLMSKLTFGLVGDGGESDANNTVEQEMPASTPEPPVPMASAQGDYDAQPESALSNEARKLAKLPFETAVSYDSVSASGKQQAVASRSTYSKHDYGITDLGDVRIAVRDMTFSGGTRGGRVIVSSEDRAKASGSAGIGNESFSFEYEKGVTACTFGTIQFTIEMGVITIDGRSVPMGQGHKLVVADAQGNVEGVYDIE